MSRICPDCEADVPVNEGDRKAYCSCGHVFDVRYDLFDWIGWVMEKSFGIERTRKRRARRRWWLFHSFMSLFRGKDIT